MLSNTLFQYTNMCCCAKRTAFRTMSSTISPVSDEKQRRRPLWIFYKYCSQSFLYFHWVNLLRDVYSQSGQVDFSIACSPVVSIWPTGGSFSGLPSSQWVFRLRWARWPIAVGRPGDIRSNRREEDRTDRLQVGLFMILFCFTQVQFLLKHLYLSHHFCFIFLIITNIIFYSIS